MNVLTAAVPVPRDGDPVGSLREMYTYLFDLSEQIDYTLSRQGIQLGRVSLPATQEQVDKLTALAEQLSTTVNSLSTAVTALSDRVSGYDESIADLSDRVSGYDESIADLSDRVTECSDCIAPLEEQVYELQLQQGMHVTEYDDLMEVVSIQSIQISDLEERLNASGL